MIYKDVTNALINVLSRFKGVRMVKYQSDDLNNQQHNYRTIQCYIDDSSYHQFNITQNRVKAEYNIFILGFPDDDNSILDIQDECYNVAVNFLAYIDYMPEYQNIISVYDYSIITLSHYTAQNNAGVKLTVVLTIPNGANLCEEWINDEPYEEEQDTEIDIDVDEVGDIELQKIELPKRPIC